jgi:hypothetical protein
MWGVVAPIHRIYPPITHINGILFLYKEPLFTNSVETLDDQAFVRQTLY